MPALVVRPWANPEPCLCLLLPPSPCLFQLGQGLSPSVCVSRSPSFSQLCLNNFNPLFLSGLAPPTPEEFSVFRPFLPAPTSFSARELDNPPLPKTTPGTSPWPFSLFLSPERACLVWTLATLTGPGWPTEPRLP